MMIVLKAIINIPGGGALLLAPGAGKPSYTSGARNQNAVPEEKLQKMS
jgi:hypothetical protein